MRPSLLFRAAPWTLTVAAVALGLVLGAAR